MISPGTDKNVDQKRRRSHHPESRNPGPGRGGPRCGGGRSRRTLDPVND